MATVKWPGTASWLKMGGRSLSTTSIAEYSYLRKEGFRWQEQSNWWQRVHALAGVALQACCACAVVGPANARASWPTLARVRARACECARMRVCVCVCVCLCASSGGCRRSGPCMGWYYDSLVSQLPWLGNNMPVLCLGGFERFLAQRMHLVVQIPAPRRNIASSPASGG